jgi:hypothetical protein
MALNPGNPRRNGVADAESWPRRHPSIVYPPSRQGAMRIASRAERHGRRYRRAATLMLDLRRFVVAGQGQARATVSADAPLRQGGLPYIDERGSRNPTDAARASLPGPHGQRRGFRRRNRPRWLPPVLGFTALPGTTPGPGCLHDAPDGGHASSNESRTQGACGAPLTMST